MPLSSSENPSGSIAALAHCAVLVPAWQPEPSLLTLVAQLLAAGFVQIILVNDGSDAKHAAIFSGLTHDPRVTVLTHAVNLGKGRALKTGINHILGLPSDILGVVTADADGQHRTEDIVAVAQRLLSGNDPVILGTRTFHDDVPLRSRLGNQLTRIIFTAITGKRVADTQTGLRGFRRDVLPELLTLDGERYEYEMTVLAHVCQQRSPIQVPIETVYIDGNRGSHFDPIWDSMRIYFVLVRFFFSAIVTAAVDLVSFSAAYAVTGNVLASVVVGRISSLVNFTLNKRFVFRSGASVITTLWRYYALVVTLGAISYGSIWALTRHAHWNVFAAKLAVDAVLSFVSFSVQRTFVFRRNDLS